MSYFDINYLFPQSRTWVSFCQDCGAIIEATSPNDPLVIYHMEHCTKTKIVHEYPCDYCAKNVPMPFGRDAHNGSHHFYEAIKNGDLKKVG